MVLAQGSLTYIVELTGCDYVKYLRCVIHNTVIMSGTRVKALPNKILC